MKQKMVCKTSEDGYIEACDGVMRKTLVYGANTLMVEFKLSKGKGLPMHKHPHEQTGYLVSGKSIMIMDGKKYEMSPGDSWSIPGNMEHGAEVIEDSIVVEVFSPVREDYLPENK